jgi:hypothetical protein
MKASSFKLCVLCFFVTNESEFICVSSLVGLVELCYRLLGIFTRWISFTCLNSVWFLRKWKLWVFFLSLYLKNGYIIDLE